MTENSNKFNEITDERILAFEKEQILTHLKQRYIKTYMEMAHIMGQSLSYCERLKVGSLIVTQNNEMLVGFNGAPSGFPNVCELPGQNVTDPRTLHGESNAISKAAKSSLSILNSNLFVSHQPCLECSKLIVQAGVRRVFFKETYRLSDGLEFMTDSRTGVQVIKVDENYEIEKIYNPFRPYFDYQSQYIYNRLTSLENKVKELEELLKNK